MKNKFLSLALSCFVFLTVAYIVSSSFFFFTKDARALSAVTINCPTALTEGASATCTALISEPLSSGFWVVNGVNQSGSVNLASYSWTNIPAGTFNVSLVGVDAGTGMTVTSNTVTVVATAVAYTCTANGGTCMVSGCGGFTPVNGTCPPAGGSCCSPQPAPTASATDFVCNANVFTGGLVQCGKGNGPEDCTFEAFICLLRRIMNFLLFVLAVPIAAISFAYAGWLYLSAAGNESKVKQAHEIFGTVALGLCLALAAWLIVHAIVLGLGVDSQYNFLGG
jgi:hypothetical protein